MKLDKFYINGEWVSPVKDEKIDIINPFEGLNPANRARMDGVT